MILKSLHLKNFLSFNELHLDFPLGLFLFEGYNYDNETSNGSGKSTIFDAITYSLYGKTPRGCKLDDFAKWGSNGEIYCRVDLLEDDICYTIIRQRSPDKLELYINDVLFKEYVDVSEINNKISSIVGVSYNCFVSSIYYAQNREDNFLVKNDDNKKKILTEVVGISKFDNILSNIKNDYIVSTGNLEMLLFNSKSIISTIDTIKNDIKDYDKLQENKIDSKESKLIYINNKIKFLNDRIRKNNESIQQLEQESNKIDEYKDILNKLLKKKEKISNISDNIIELKSERKNIGNKIIEKYSELKKYEDFLKKGICFTCGQTIYEVDRMKKQYDDILNEIDQYKIKEKEILSEINELTNIFESNKTKIFTKYEQYLSKYNVSLNSKNTIKNLSLDNDMLLGDIAQCEDDLNNINKVDEDFSSFKEKKIVLLNKNVDKLNEIENKIKNEKNNINILNHLKNIFGKDGVKAVVFNQIIDELNNSINKYVQRLFECPITLSFNIISDIKDGSKVIDKIQTELIIKNKSIDFNLLSGGEQKRLILAVDLALSEIMSRRNSNKFHFLILDEVFDGLDYHSKSKFMEFLQYLKQEGKKQIFVIDHDCQMKNMFDQVVMIEKRNDVSTLISYE